MKERGAGDWVQLLMPNDLIHSANVINEASVRIQNDEVQRVSRLVNIWRLRRVVHLDKAGRSFPHIMKIYLHGSQKSMLPYAKSLQSCPTLCDPIDGSHQAPPSLGFSRQEHWSGLPFPSPMHESEKWKWSLSVVSNSSRPHGLQLTRLFRPWDFPGKSTGLGCHYLLHISLLVHHNKVT